MEERIFDFASDYASNLKFYHFWIRATLVFGYKIFKGFQL